MKKAVLKTVKYLAVAAFWLAIWYLLARKVGEELLLPSPSSVISRLGVLLSEKDFYLTCLSSLLRILSGIVSGVVLGIFFAVTTCVIPPLDALLSPIFAIVKSTPVASFIMLAWLWIDKESLPSFITFLIVFPVAWANIQTGIKNAPKELIEIAKVHKIGIFGRILHIYLPSLIPFFVTTAKSALGLAWKAGIAAEVLAVPKNAIGSNIYSSKIFLETTDLFVWTLVTVLLSIFMEFVIGGLLGKLSKKYKYTGGNANAD